MARTGRPPVPNELKALRGTLRPDRVPPQTIAVTAPPSESPAPVRPLGAEGQNLWMRLWTRCGWLQPPDEELVLLVCESVDERAGLRARVLAHANWRDRAAWRALDSAIAANLSALGLDPTARGRLGLQQVTAQTTLQRLRQQRDQR